VVPYGARASGTCSHGHPVIQLWVERPRQTSLGTASAAMEYDLVLIGPRGYAGSVEVRW
jgi:hypothetical protein